MKDELRHIHEREKCYELALRRSNLKCTMTFTYNVYGGKEAALAAAIKARDELVGKIPKRRKPTGGSGNDLWRSLSKTPKRKSVSQLLLWMGRDANNANQRTSE